MFSEQCCIIFAKKTTHIMKSTTKETSSRVSDRAYRIIISDVIDSMTGCKIDPFTFKQVVTAVRHYLKPEGKPTGLGKKAKVIFDRLLPDLDRAIRRSTTARAAAARRKETAKKIAELQTETETVPASLTQQAAESKTGHPDICVETEREQCKNAVVKNAVKAPEGRYNLTHCGAVGQTVTPPHSRRAPEGATPRNRREPRHANF